jgi:hypothetical protein
MIFRDLDCIFATLKQLSTSDKQLSTPDLKLQSGFFETEEHASSTSKRGWNQNYYSF